MRLWRMVLPGMLLPAAAAAQSGFEADRLEPCLARPGLVATCSPELPPPGPLLAAGLDFAHRLLRVEGQAGGWVVERRLSLRAELGWSLWDRLLVSAGLDGAAWQTGLRLDGRGALAELGPAAGRTWLSGLWRPTPAGWPWALGVESRLVFPTADPDGLSGPGRLRWQLDLSAAARLGWLRPVVNLGLRLGEDLRFRDLRRGPTWTWGAGLLVAGADQPLAASLELVGQADLGAALGSRAAWGLEGLAGLRLAGHGLELHLAAGLGLLGPAVPAVRGICLVRWQGAKKTAFFEE